MIEFIFGGLFRLFPEVLKLIDRHKERQHELNMMQMQEKLDRLRSELKLNEVAVVADAQQSLAEMQALIEAHKKPTAPARVTGIRWVDGLIGLAEALNALVRPVLTFWYCVLAYGAYKGALLYLSLVSGSTLDSAVIGLWTSVDYSVMISIIGYWFLDRTLRKMKL